MIDAPEPSHRRRRPGVSPLEIALAVAVLLVALAVLLVARQTATTMEALVAENTRVMRASSTPLLRFESGNVTGGSESEIFFAVRNAGTGPARIVWFELNYLGKPLRSNFELIEKFGFRPSGGIATSGVPGTIIPAGEQRIFFRWKRPADGDPVQMSWRKIDEERGKLEPQACFCSLMDQCWISALNEAPPLKVAACDTSGHINLAG